MKKVIYFLLLIASTKINAQQFINSGTIEFEMRTNNHKTFGDGIWAEMFKDKIPQFSTYWYSYVFDNNKSVYQYDRMDEKTKMPWGNNNADENLWFSDYSNGTSVCRKFVFDDSYLLSDSLMKINWKLVPNETREIAGFSCRKAVGIIFDSVYVFAFYTDEILISGGPMGIHGLPGMILGITIPRMYSSWIATKVDIVNVNKSLITPPLKGKKKQGKDLIENLKKVTSDWGHWGQQALWNIFL
ncbi:MAG: GLPGLI family protein [Sphingobacteriales bacterium]|nr:GLPGLI family protein [Sphingobacteriales bacterium]